MIIKKGLKYKRRRAIAFNRSFQRELLINLLSIKLTNGAFQQGLQEKQEPEVISTAGLASKM